MAKRNYKVEFKQSANRQWRTRLFAPNGRQLAITEQYKRRPTMIRVIKDLLTALAQGRVVFTEVPLPEKKKAKKNAAGA